MSIERFVHAASNGETDTLSAMLEANPKLLKESLPNGMSPLTAALYYGKQDAVEWLLERGVPVTVHEAAALGDYELLSFLLQAEPRLLSEVSFDGWTPLHLAVFFGGFEAAKLLIDRGADVDARSGNPMSNMPIHAAAAGRRTALVQLLLENGAHPDAPQSGGWTPLQQAADHGDAGMVELLLRHGANADLTQDDGRTARSIADGKGYTEIINILPPQ